MPRHTMNISLTPELERQVQELVERGLYTSQSEVVRSGLRLLFERQNQAEFKLAALRKAVALGMEDVEAGRGYSLSPDEVIERCRKATQSKLEARESGHSEK